LSLWAWGLDAEEGIDDVCMIGVGGPNRWWILGLSNGVFWFPGFLFFILFPHFLSTARYPSAHFFWDTGQYHIGYIYSGRNGTIQNQIRDVSHHTTILVTNRRRRSSYSSTPSLNDCTARILTALDTFTSAHQAYFLPSTEVHKTFTTPSISPDKETHPLYII
jgi:hypothetical protein